MNLFKLAHRIAKSSPSFPLSLFYPDFCSESEKNIVINDRKGSDRVHPRNISGKKRGKRLMFDSKQGQRQNPPFVQLGCGRFPGKKMVDAE